MDNQDLYILKGNFVQFRNDNIIDSYEFYPKVIININFRNLVEGLMELSIKLGINL